MKVRHILGILVCSAGMGIGAGRLQATGLVGQASNPAAVHCNHGGCTFTASCFFEPFWHCTVVFVGQYCFMESCNP